MAIRKVETWHITCDWCPNHVYEGSNLPDGLLVHIVEPVTLKHDQIYEHFSGMPIQEVDAGSTAILCGDCIIRVASALDELRLERSR